MTLYTHGDIVTMYFDAPYDTNPDIWKSLKPHLIIGKVLDEFGTKIYGPVHHIATLQGTDCIEFLLFGN